MTAAARQPDFVLHGTDATPDGVNEPENTAQVHPFPPPVTKKAGQKLGRRTVVIIGVMLAVTVGAVVIGKKMLAPKGASLAAVEESGPPSTSIVATLTARMNTVEADIASLKGTGAEGLALLQNDFHALQTQVANLGASSPDLLTLTTNNEHNRANLNEHGRRLAALERAEQDRKAHAVQIATTEARAKSESPTLPFRAMSLDLWGGKPYVAIALPERRELELVAPGDRRLGWEVVAIDNRSGQVIFKDEQGRTLTKVVEEHR